MLAYKIEECGWFTPAQEKFSHLVAHLETTESNTMTLSEMENLIREQLQSIGRDLTEAKMNMIGSLKSAIVVKGSDDIERPRQKLLGRQVETIFGEVHYHRWGYGAPGVASLFPADGHLNVPQEKYTHEVSRLVSEDVTRTSFDDALSVLSERTAALVPKRQGLELAQRAATDFTTFYDKQAEAGATVEPEASGPILVLTTDGKGVVMRSDGLRPATRKAADRTQHKLKNRLSRGEKRDRKRMAQVASVYTVAPHERTAAHIVGNPGSEFKAIAPKPPSPKPENKRVWASLEQEPDQVLDKLFSEAQTRDPEHEKQWVALVDGNPSQLRMLHERATSFKVAITIILDIIHVLEYLWKASRAFFPEASPEAEQFVTERLLNILMGRSSQVAKGITKMATARKLAPKERKAVDVCAEYLLKYKEYLRYDQYLARGLPIATGVIEGACRYLVKDRMDITGARWGLAGAEAILRLRSLRVSGDFRDYWDYHERMELERNHLSSYANGCLPPLQDHEATHQKSPVKSHLRLVKG